MNMQLILEAHLKQKQKFHFWLKNRLKKKIKKAYLLERNATKQRFSNVMDALNDIAKNMFAYKTSLIIELAKQSLNMHLDKKPELVINMTINAIKNAPRTEFLEVCCHPLDEIVLKKEMKKLLPASKNAANISFKIDENFASRGDLIIRSAKTIVDARIETQLNKAKRLLKCSR